MHQLLKGLLGLRHAELVQHDVPEPRVEQVQHRVLRASDVQVDGEPVCILLRRDERVGVLVVGEAKIVPAAPRPLRHRVRLAGEPLSLLLEVAPVDCAGEAARGVVAGGVVLHLWQLQRQLGNRDGDRLVVQNLVLRAGARVARRVLEADREVDWDGLAPVPLAREDPVAKLVRRLRVAEAALLEVGDDGDLARFRVEAVEFSAVDGRARAAKRQLLRAALDDALHVEVVDLCKVKVAFVVGWNSHDGARAIRR
mmetsp:Transcript_28863/g.97291  ORF Transcript_28863/g.97291 Transcript_28863/m.97291 type:complete len:254 (-) Transcript_28863:1022-1783(-)